MTPSARKDRTRRNFTNTSNRYDAKRERLVLCARELAEQGNASKVSVTDVTSAMGITRGLFYYYFGGKEELYAAVLDTYLDDLVKGLEKVDADVDDREATVGLLVEAVVGWLYEGDGSRRPIWHVIKEMDLSRECWQRAAAIVSDKIVSRGLLAKNGRTHDEQSLAHAHFVAVGIIGEAILSSSTPTSQTADAACASLRYRKRRA